MAFTQAHGAERMREVLTALRVCHAYQHALDVYDFGIKNTVAQDRHRLEQLVCGLLKPSDSTAWHTAQKQPKPTF